LRLPETYVKEREDMNGNGTALRDEITEAKIIEYLDAAGMTGNLTESEKRMFVNIAREFGLNPFKREIYITVYGKGEYRKCSIITGYEVYIKRAERAGKLDGWRCWTEGEGKNLKALAEIYRKDQKHPFVHEAYYEECCQYNREGKPNAVWAKMPRFMCRKAAIGQAFRLCFPDDLGGMPYEEAETPGEGPRNVTEEPPEPEKLPEPEKPPGKAGTSRADMLKAIGEMLHSKNPDGLAWFTGAEIDREREAARKAGGMPEIRGQLARLTAELASREAAYTPIPFEDGDGDGDEDGSAPALPALHEQEEPGEDGGELFY
jgi:phage recombination protein Bet